jgi:hypothetical protein
MILWVALVMDSELQQKRKLRRLLLAKEVEEWSEFSLRRVSLSTAAHRGLMTDVNYDWNRALKKVNTSGMKKLTGFFTKKT